MSARIPTIVLGGTGYVAGELLRLIAGHPNLKLAGVLSDSQPGEPVAKAFSHLAARIRTRSSRRIEEIETAGGHAAAQRVFSAAPHGASAALIDRLLTARRSARARSRSVVDISADYRYSTDAAYAAVYKHAHGAPQRLTQFTCAVPEHLAERADAACRASGLLRDRHPAGLGAAAEAGLATPQLFVTGVTGSTGSGRKPVEGTHHPLRHSDLYAYNPLAHRHTPEVTACAKAASGVDAHFAFVPHSGPFARGIHVTVQAQLAKPATHGELRRKPSATFYAHSPFVRVSCAAAAREGRGGQQLRAALGGQRRQAASP